MHEEDFTFDEAVGWIGQFVRERKRHYLHNEYATVIRKYDVYRQLAKKMGRGLWKDVLALGQRLGRGWTRWDPGDSVAPTAQGHARTGELYKHNPFPISRRDWTWRRSHSTAFPEMASTCRIIGQPGRFREASGKGKAGTGHYPSLDHRRPDPAWRTGPGLRRSHRPGHGCPYPA